MRTAGVILTALILSGIAQAHSGPPPAIPLVWLKIADCESGDGDGRPPYRPNWRYNVGLYDGGLNFHPSTWRDAVRLYKPARRYAYAYLAPPRIQVHVAAHWLKVTSWHSQWPTCSRLIGL